MSKLLINKQSARFTEEFGEVMATCWTEYGRYGFSLEVFMDEILDGRKVGVDVAVVQTNQGVLYEVKGKKKVFEVVANVWEKDGRAYVWYREPSEVKKIIEDTLQYNRELSRNRKAAK